jgi:hypothetical protein
MPPFSILSDNVIQDGEYFLINSDTLEPLRPRSFVDINEVPDRIPSWFNSFSSYDTVDSRRSEPLLDAVSRFYKRGIL